MQKNSYDVVVIGAGSGGLTAAVGFSKVGKSVLLVRASLQCAEAGARASNDYIFGLVEPTELHVSEGPRASAYINFPGLIPADRTNFTASLQGRAVCESRCNATAT